MDRRTMLKGFAAQAGMRALVVESGVEAQAAYPTWPIPAEMPHIEYHSRSTRGRADNKLCRPAPSRSRSS